MALREVESGFSVRRASSKSAGLKKLPTLSALKGVAISLTLRFSFDLAAADDGLSPMPLPAQIAIPDPIVSCQVDALRRQAEIFAAVSFTSAIFRAASSP